MNKLSIIALSTVVVGAYAFFYIQNKPVDHQITGVEPKQQIGKGEIPPEPQLINRTNTEITQTVQAKTTPLVKTKQLQLVPPSSDLDARAPTSQNIASQPRLHGHENQSNDPRNNAPRPPGEPQRPPAPQSAPVQ